MITIDSATAYDMRLKSPFTAMIAGNTGSGKTLLLKRLIENSKAVCDSPPVEIIYCYGVWQKLFETFEGVRFVEGLLNFKEDIPNDGLSRWVVIDDLMEETAGKSETNALYTKYSHHKNVSVFFVVQNFFRKEQRTMSLNSHYLFLFKNLRDSSFISHLSKQVFPGNSSFLAESYQDATSLPYSYLLIDLKQNTPDKVRIIGNFLSDNDNPLVVYVPK